MTLIEAVKGTYAMVGQELSDLQLAMTAEKLKEYPVSSVMTALSRCQDELKKITFTDILDRIPGGHPGPEEAWATIAKVMKNETLTLVWTDEMREAYGVANGVSDDPVQARMAFKEKYSQLMSEARAHRTPLNWSVSKGTDKADQERAIFEGVKHGRLSTEYAQRIIPHATDPQLTAQLAALCPRLLS